MPDKKDTDSLLKEARDRLALCVKHESENRREAMEDFRFFAGEQWPEDMRNLRQIEKRPCLTINKLPAFVHQVINDQRMNRPSIKVHPVDSGADPDVAEVQQGMIRYIEYNSNADACYDTAVSHATIGGFGYFRLVTEYADEASFDQEIKFKRIQNPFTVYFDPFSVEPDGSDAMFCFITDLISREEFKAQYPDGVTGSADALVVGAGDAQLTWITDETVRIAEYYKIKTTPATLVRLADGRDVFEEDMADGDEIALGADGKPLKRATERRTVCWYKITAAEVLEETEIPCRWIPVFPVFGDEHIVDGRVRRAGMVRFARDPQRMYNFWMTSATEEVSLRPKTPFIGAVGQFDTAKKDWRQANTRSFAFLEYDPVEANGTLAPPPQRQPMSDVPVGVLQMAMHASDNIKATTGIFDASLGARGNETSGKAIVARQREGDTANFHFSDNLARTIRHAGRCLLHMIPRIYDTPRVVRVLGEDEKMGMAEVNAPAPQGQMAQNGAIQTVLNDLTTGRYDVTIGVGPSYTTKRAEAVDAMMQVGQAWPNLWQVAGDKMIRAMDWPDADEIAERVAKTIPPQLRDDETEQQAQLPPQVMQVLQQAQMEIQQLQQALQEAQSGVAVKRMELESRERIEAAKLQLQAATAAQQDDLKRDLAELAGVVQLLAKQVQPPQALAAEVQGDLSEQSASSPT